jgi:hypothetical protein
MHQPCLQAWNSATLICSPPISCGFLVGDIIKIELAVEAIQQVS